jgi:hypothetical protein
MAGDDPLCEPVSASDDDDDNDENKINSVDSLVLNDELAEDNELMNSLSETETAAEPDDHGPSHFLVSEEVDVTQEVVAKSVSVNDEGDGGYMIDSMREPTPKAGYPIDKRGDLDRLCVRVEKLSRGVISKVYEFYMTNPELRMSGPDLCIIYDEDGVHATDLKSYEDGDYQVRDMTAREIRTAKRFNVQIIEPGSSFVLLY